MLLKAQENKLILLVVSCFDVVTMRPNIEVQQNLPRIYIYILDILESL